jgi:hypothetical protein
MVHKMALPYNNKKFWEELITYIPFKKIWVSDITIKKAASVCMRNEANKTIEFERL